MAGERTEQATPKRRSDARHRGQVLKSMEINTAAILAGGAAFLQWSLPGITRSLTELSVHTFENPTIPLDITPTTLYSRGLAMALLVARLVFPVLLPLMVVGVVANLGQVGFLLTTQPLKPDFSRINPLQGVKRFFTTRILVEFLKTLLKVAVIGGFAWQALHDKGGLLALMIDMQPGMAGATLTGTIMSVVWRVTLGFVVLAALDFLYQRWWFEKSMRMSKQEIKEEMRQAEGDPQIKARLRARARALARQRMMQQVPKADVVVTNPTHFAVALKYEAGMEAPIVIAKGERLIAQQIKKIAREHGVPMVENKPLAQALFKSCDVGQPVPPDLFKAVAEVLAFVYRLHPNRAPAGYGQAAA